MEPIKIIHMIVTNIFLKRLIGTHTRINTISALTPARIVHMVEYSLGEIDTKRPKIDTPITLHITHIAPGNAFEITFCRKLPFTRLPFGSSVNTKLGIPVAKAEIKVNWMGLNG